MIERNWHGRLSHGVLRGWRCSDGRPLRFWFSNGELPFRGRGSIEQLATAGSKRLTVRLADLRQRHLFMVGYLLFSSPGRWVVEGQAKGHPQVAALFDFPG